MLLDVACRMELTGAIASLGKERRELVIPILSFPFPTKRWHSLKDVDCC